VVGNTLLTSRLTSGQPVAEKPALLVVFLSGGYNALFSSPQSFTANGTFGVTASNQRDLGNGLVVDAATLGSLPEIALSHMATVGVRHELAEHGAAQQALFSAGTRGACHRLAAAMGGAASIKYAQVGRNRVPGPQTTENGVSLQVITDLLSTREALQGSTDRADANRAIAATALRLAPTSGSMTINNSPTMTRHLAEGYATAPVLLTQTVELPTLPELASAYSLGGTETGIASFSSQMAAAELMIAAGSNVVVAVDDFRWDSHGDRDGRRVRSLMSESIVPGLSRFISRMMTKQERNVVVAILGDFARSLPSSDHASALSATIIGKRVRVGSTGRMTGDVSLPEGTPGVGGFWSCVAAAMGLPSTILGPNQHPAIVAEH
jgi:hypothetical protein